MYTPVWIWHGLPSLSSAHGPPGNQKPHLEQGNTKATRHQIMNLNRCKTGVIKLWSSSYQHLTICGLIPELIAVRIKASTKHNATCSSTFNFEERKLWKFIKKTKHNKKKRTKQKNCSPPLAYSITKYRVFSVSITSNNFTADRRKRKRARAERQRERARQKEEDRSLFQGVINLRNS